MTGRSLLKSSLAGILIAAGVLLPFPFASAGEQVLKIGVTTPLTGPNAMMGRSNREGAELAVEEINGRGGVNGVKLVLFVSDDRVVPAEGVSNAQRYINSEKVSVLATTMGSSVTMAVMPVALQNRVPLLVPAATADMITEQGNAYAFQTCPNNTDTVVRQVEYLATKVTPHPQTAAILYENTDYGVNMVDVLTKHLGRVNIKLLTSVSYIQDAVEYYSELTKIKSENPDLLFILGKYTDNALAARQAREVGIKARLSGGNTWVIPEFLSIAGAAAEGASYPSFFEPTLETPKAKQFVAAYKAKYGRDPDWIAASIYDAIYLAADALKRAASTEGPALRDALAKTKGLEGASGVTTFDAHNKSERQVFITEIRNGKRVVVW
jgi:branched-chain amino acid transport system substrate-binding protein